MTPIISSLVIYAIYLVGAVKTILTALGGFLLALAVIKAIDISSPSDQPSWARTNEDAEAEKAKKKEGIAQITCAIKIAILLFIIAAILPNENVCLQMLDAMKGVE